MWINGHLEDESDRKQTESLAGLTGKQIQNWLLSLTGMKLVLIVSYTHRRAIKPCAHRHNG